MEVNSLEDKIYVPIGVDCSVASMCRDLGLRSTALPFDWNVCPLGSALELLENKFECFLKSENLLYMPVEHRLLFKEDGISVQRTKDLITPVFCRRYYMLFPHDFSSAGKNDLEAVRYKYSRRIHRLLGYLESGARLVLVWNPGPINKWQTKQYSAAGYELSSQMDYFNSKEFRLRIQRLGVEVMTLSELAKKYDRLYFVRKKIRRYFKILGF